MGAHVGGIVPPRGVQDTAAAVFNVFNNVENLQYIHKLFTHSMGLIQGITQSQIARGIGELTKMMGSADVLINGTQLFTFGPYFCRKRTEEDVPRKLIERNGQILEVEQAKRDVKVGNTPFVYEIANKPQRAIAGLGFFVAYLSSTVSLLESIKVPVFATVSKGLGYIPVIGKTLGSGFSHYFFVFGGYALITAHTALVFDAIRYIYLAQTDTDKDQIKGYLQLAARVAVLALDLFIVCNVGNPIVIGVAGVLAGALGIAYLVYKFVRQNQKAQAQEELYARAQAQLQQQQLNQEQALIGEIDDIVDAQQQQLNQEQAFIDSNDDIIEVHPPQANQEHVVIDITDDIEAQGQQNVNLEGQQQLQQQQQLEQVEFVPVVV